MKSIQIKDSYCIWNTKIMKELIREACYKKYKRGNASRLFNRTYKSMYIEWYLHNIGYYITKSFCHIESLRKINLRCKDVDLEEWETK